jgi:uncharacterized protein with beta-barrel porin domain
VQAGATVAGTLTQQDGVMTINGNGAAATVMLKGGLLKGSGSIGLLSQTGGTFAPGNSPGTITVDNYTLQTGGELVLEIDGSDPSQYDHLIVTGDATLLGTVVLDFSDYTGGAFSFNDILQVGGTLRTSLTNALGTQQVTLQTRGLNPAMPSQLVWGPQGLSVHIGPGAAGIPVASAVPESDAWVLALAGMGVLGMLWWRSKP